MSEQPPVAQPEAQSASADDIATQAGQTASESAPDSMDVAGQGKSAAYTCTTAFSSAPCISQELVSGKQSALRVIAICWAHD